MFSPYSILADAVGISARRRRRHKRKQGGLLKSPTRSVPLFLPNEPRFRKRQLVAVSYGRALARSPRGKLFTIPKSLVRDINRRVAYANDIARRARDRRATAVRGLDLFGSALDKRTRVCVRRTIRKQVLFAAGVAGRSGGSPGKGGYVHTPNSSVRC